jgi:hypothetical protein
MLNRDYQDILQCLAEEHAEFIVVGAYALAAHGFPRSTADFDIWVNPTEANAIKVYRALTRFGAPLQDVSPTDFAEEGIMFQIGVAPCRIDIITKISGDIPFVDAVSHAEKIVFGDVTMPILSLDDLIKNKLATGRQKDQADVALLKQRQL